MNSNSMFVCSEYQINTHHSSVSCWMDHNRIHSTTRYNIYRTVRPRVMGTRGYNLSFCTHNIITLSTPNGMMIISLQSVQTLPKHLGSNLANVNDSQMHSINDNHASHDMTECLLLVTMTRGNRLHPLIEMTCMCGERVRKGVCGGFALSDPACDELGLNACMHAT
jgi:hypothetical protein